jgi:hypothetical protein
MRGRRIFLDRVPIYRALATVPALSHWPDRSLPFDPERSELLRWIRERREGMTAEEAARIFQQALKKGLLRFDRITLLWRGSGDTTKLDQRMKGGRPKGAARAAQEKPKVEPKDGGDGDGCAEGEGKEAPAPAPSAPPRPAKPRGRPSTRLASAVAVWKAWLAASKVRQWSFSDLRRSFAFHGSIELDTAKKYLKSLAKAGFLERSANGFWMACSTEK